MTRAMQELLAIISRLEEQHGPDNQFVCLLKEHLKEIEASGSSQTETWTERTQQILQDIPLNLNNLPFDPAVAAGISSLLTTSAETQGSASDHMQTKPK